MTPAPPPQDCVPFDCSPHDQASDQLGAFGALLVNFLGDRRLGLAARDVAWHAISSEAEAERRFAQVAADHGPVPHRP